MTCLTNGLILIKMTYIDSDPNNININIKININFSFIMNAKLYIYTDLTSF